MKYPFEVISDLFQPRSKIIEPITSGELESLVIEVLENLFDHKGMIKPTALEL